ncbi:MAG TPA: hypothetical protein VNU19_09230 [Candidatus Acidoferrum sp.]|nr:hypothetical protein [Candidatus Acidoferrum sp.]
MALAVSTACTPSAQSTNPSPKPSPPKLAVLPVGRDVFFYSTDVYAPLNPVGWDGTRYAQLQLGTLTGSQAIQSPDGSKLIVDNVVYDRATGSTTQLPFVANKGTQVMWADDSAHICVLYPLGDSQQPGGTASELDLLQPGGATRVVAHVGHDEAQAFALLRSCSVANDVAIVAQRAVLPISDVWVVRISTGGIIRHLSYQQGAEPSTVVAAPDGSWIAAVGTATTEIVDTGTGSTVAHLYGQAVAFSGDGKVLVLGDRVIDWRTDQTLWLAPHGFEAIFVLAEPSGSAVAVDAMGSPGSPTATTPSQLWLVASSMTIRIADGVVPSFVTST